MTRKNQAGVTLLEVVVAIFVITVGLISALALIISSITGARTSKYQLAAGNLARQAIEVVRVQRDSNWLEIESGSLDPGLWDQNLSGNGMIYTGIINFQDDPALADYMKWTIFYDSTYNFTDNPVQLKTYFVDHGSWRVYNQYTQANPPGLTESGFRLAMSTKPICILNGVESMVENGFSCETTVPAKTKIGIQIKATVKWIESGIERSYEQEEKIYNWK
ncbi:MAG: prepilin-type N-terminal cleavage/methylation domain-containing protein [Patescibacteria group bacterium]